MSDETKVLQAIQGAHARGFSDKPPAAIRKAAKRAVQRPGRKQLPAPEWAVLRQRGLPPLPLKRGDR